MTSQYVTRLAASEMLNPSGCTAMTCSSSCRLACQPHYFSKTSICSRTAAAAAANASSSRDCRDIFNPYFWASSVLGYEPIVTAVCVAAILVKASAGIVPVTPCISLFVPRQNSQAPPYSRIQTLTSKVSFSPIREKFSCASCWPPETRSVCRHHLLKEAGNARQDVHALHGHERHPQSRRPQDLQSLRMYGLSYSYS